MIDALVSQTSPWSFNWNLQSPISYFTTSRGSATSHVSNQPPHFHPRYFFSSMFSLSLLIFIYLFLFIWLCHILAVAHEILDLCCIMQDLGMWDLVPWPGIEPGPPVLGARRPPGKSLQSFLRFCVYVCETYECAMCVLSHSVVSDSLRPYGLACQAPVSMGFSRQQYWSGLPCPPPGDLPTPGIEPRSPALQVYSLPIEPPGNPRKDIWMLMFKNSWKKKASMRMHNDENQPL